MKLDMVGLKVQNMAQSLAFYEALGFGVLSGGPNETYAELNNNGVRVSLNLFTMLSEVYQIPLEDVLNQNEAAIPKVELAFLVDEPKQVDDKYQELKDKGYEIYREPWDAFWGQRYAIIKDPDNNLLSLFAHLEG
ncbi:VOC family protein [Niallia nealsonii]|uniref:Glyoxylase n=1 Tax=Niallia nealsonii TaxID=115979 RepID=A0A2N0Z0C8_9BACI|nr:VOC family protein [Niallia nealsonii]PKG22964.1 glyoxylase [Niallia nealsonii]